MDTLIRATKHFQHFTSDQRANMAASHRLGFRQKQAIGEAFWTHVDVPGIAFPTRKAAEAAAERARAARTIAA